MPITFSDVEIVNQWEIDLSTGVFTVPKTTTYICAFSGTAASNILISLYLNDVVQTVKLQQFQDYSYGGYTRGFNQIFVKKLNAGDLMCLKYENDNNILMAALTPFTFSCSEIN